MSPLSSFAYGADSSGLICGFRFDLEGRGHAMDSDAALDRITQVHAADAFVWLHFNLTQPVTLRWMQKHLPLPEVFYEGLKDGVRSTRVELDDDVLIAVLNDVHYDFSFEPSDISTLWIGVAPRFVVTARLTPLRSVDRLREAVKAGERFQSPVALLVHLMHDQGDVLVDIVRVCTQRVDAVEDKLHLGRLAGGRSDLGALRRVMVRLQRLLAPEPAALFRLLRSPPGWISPDDVGDLHQSTEEFNVALSDLAALQERVKLVQEEVAAGVAEANNRSLFLLTIVTVLALPINMIAGLLGMNVGGIPLADHPHGFWIIVAIVVTFTALAGWIAFRASRDPGR